MMGQVGIILSVSFILIIALSVLAGLIKGMRKSLFQLVFSIVFFILALITIPFIAEAILNMDISSYKQYFPAEIQDNVSTVKGTIASALIENLPDYQVLFTPGSETLEIVYGVVKLVVIIVLFLLYFIFSFTILKLITLIFGNLLNQRKS